MRSLSEIVQANIDAEAKEARNAEEDKQEEFDAAVRILKRPENSFVDDGIERAHKAGGPTMDYAINRCKACDEPADDCFCDHNPATKEELK